MKKVTVLEVARAADVSGTTVSLAFRENSRISEKTRRKVLEVAEALNYTPNLAAQNLRHGETRSLAFIVNDICNPFYGLMLKDAEIHAEKRGYNIVFGSSNWSADKEKCLIDQMIQSRVCGLIICFCEKRFENLVSIEKANLPCIAVDSYPDWYEGAYVSNDFKKAGELAAEHLMAIGCKRPVYFNAGKGMVLFSAFRKIETHFAERLRELGIAYDERGAIDAGLDIESGRKAAIQAMKDGIVFDGAFCSNDLCALGVRDGLLQLGKQSEDIAVMGIDDIETGSLSATSLTTIHQPYSEIAKLATESLLRSVESGESPKIKKELIPRLVVRESTRRRRKVT